MCRGTSPYETAIKIVRINLTLAYLLSLSMYNNCMILIYSSGTCFTLFRTRTTLCRRFTKFNLLTLYTRIPYTRESVIWVKFKELLKKATKRYVHFYLNNNIHTPGSQEQMFFYLPFITTRSSVFDCECQSTLCHLVCTYLVLLVTNLVLMPFFLLPCLLLFSSQH